MKAIKLIVNIILFLLILVLCINNSQTISINLYGVYTFNMPLIMALIIFALFGFIIGLLFSLPRRIKSKAQISKLEKQLDKYASTESKDNSHIV